ncbi:unnamed protein product [Brassicogethes aeneus]|uniref:Uncharacterized protein n=1 Tax=Brassicogethes aeneus TaxID=1431903 RepID=A0A9P0FDH0_BRAAE|nr:unnamed protein product [Brassicogethes aeneus]
MAPPNVDTKALKKAPSKIPPPPTKQQNVKPGSKLNMKDAKGDAKKGVKAPEPVGKGKGKGGKGEPEPEPIEEPPKPKVFLPKKKPVYEAPKPVIFKKWIPPDERPKPPKPAKYEAPKPTITHHWIPPDRRKKPPPPPKYEAPPLPSPKRKWIPPDKRKPKPKPEPKFKPPSPAGKTLHVPHTRNFKCWGPFKYYDGLTEPGYLIGRFSQSHKRFGKYAGQQDLTNSVVACGAINVIKNYKDWDNNVVSSILQSGHHLYEESRKKMKCKEAPFDLSQIINYYYHGAHKILIEIQTELGVEEVIKECSKMAKVIELIKFFFDMNHNSGVLVVNYKSFCIWKSTEKGKTYYYFFDPRDHTEHGEPLDVMPRGQGFSVVGKTGGVKSLSTVLLKNLPSFGSGVSFSITPVAILKIEKIDTGAPTDYEDVIAKKIPESKECKKLGDQEGEAPKRPIKDKKEDKKETPETEEEMTKKLAEAAEKRKIEQAGLEINPEATADIPNKPSFLQEVDIDNLKENRQEKQITVTDELALQRIKPKLLSRYVDLVSGMVGILRGRTFQSDNTFTKYNTKQAMGNVIACFTMLRLYRARAWKNTQICDIHQYGEIYYNEARKKKPLTMELRLTDFPKIHFMLKNNYMLDFKENECYGQLSSEYYERMDLFVALENFMINNNCCMVGGPLVVAIWKEEGRYYLFDPNERDEKGRRIEVSTTNRGEGDVPRGVSCVMWFMQLADLCEHYMTNVRRENRHDLFTLSAIRILDDPELPPNFYNFVGFKKNRWIMLADFSQGDARFDHEGRGNQCTAMASMSLMYSILDNKLGGWSKDTLNEILMEGDQLYRDSMEKLRRSDPNYTGLMLCGEDIQPRTVLEKFQKEVHCSPKAAVYGNIIKNAEFPDFLEGLDSFFTTFTHGLCTSGSITVGFWKASPREYFYFDSHSRNNKGLTAPGGRAMLVRTTNVVDLANCMLPNIPVGGVLQGIFNLFELDMKFVDIVDEVPRPAEGLYRHRCEEDGELVVILRGQNSLWSEQFVANAGKQTLATCLIALGYNKVKEGSQWCTTDVDLILDKGDKHYVDSYEAREDKEQEDITMDNVLKEFSIGYNKLTLDVTTVNEGNIKEKLIETLATFYLDNEDLEDVNRETILETESYTVALFKDKNAFYLYDPNQRDKKGNVIGRADWDDPGDVVETNETDETNEFVDTGESGATDERKESGDVKFPDAQEGKEKVGGKGKKSPSTSAPTSPSDAPAPPAPSAEEDDGTFEVKTFFKSLPIRNWDEMGKPRHRKFKYPPEYWDEQIETYGRACALKFLLLQDLVCHVFTNIPASERVEKDFKLHKVEMLNELSIVEKHRPDTGATMENIYDGDWYKFVEIERGKWVLNGTLKLNDEVFPEMNRGKQNLTACLCCLLYNYLFPINRFTPDTMDKILSYGDKIYTRIKKDQFQNLKANSSLREEEINIIIADVRVTLENIYKRLRVGKHYVKIDIERAETGHIFAPEDQEDMLDLKRALEKFFENNTHGLLEANGLLVGIFKGATVYFMYDPHERGPDGSKDPIGRPCLTRFLDLDKLISLFKSNINPYGTNYFDIYSVCLEEFVSKQAENAEVDLEAEKTLPQPAEPGTTALPGLTLGGWKKISGGKFILRGTLENCNFAPVKTAAFNFIALAMSLIHKPSIWTYPMIVEIGDSGDDLFKECRGENDPPFDLTANPLIIEKTKNLFNVGNIKCHVILRLPGLVGNVNSKSSGQLNLRQALESLFKTNTHGILEIGGYTISVWEDYDAINDKPLIYLYDPVPRGATGMPIAYGGKPCALYFVHDTLFVSQHIKDILSADMNEDGEFVLTAVEVVAGGKKSKKGGAVKAAKTCQMSMAKKKDISAFMKMNEQQEKLRRLKEIDQLGRYNYHCVMPGEILRSYRNLEDKQYEANCRGFQDLTCCIMAAVMSELQAIETWSCSTLDIIMDSGTQLYLDSYLTYRSENPKIGYHSVLRKFFLKDEKINIVIYKPMMPGKPNPPQISWRLEQLFMDAKFAENFIIMEYLGLFFCVFHSSEKYYLYCPYGTNHKGEVDKEGTSVLFKFYNIRELANRFVTNFSWVGERVPVEENKFMLTMIKVITNKNPETRTKCDL